MQISRVTRVSNPRSRRASRKRRGNPKKLSLKQKLHFGSARQRAAAKAALRKRRANPKRRRTSATKRRRANPVRRRRRVARAAPRRRKRRASNPAHMITLGLLNPAPRRGNSKRRKKVNSMAKIRRRRSRRVSANSRRWRSRNSVKVIVRRRNRRRLSASNPRRRRRRSNVRAANPRRRRRSYSRNSRRSGRRNPVIFGHSVGMLEMAKIVAAGLAGVALTKAVPNMLPQNMLPASPATGAAISFAVAIGLGMLTTSLIKGDPMIGYAVGFGGLMQALSVGLNSFFPQAGAYIGLHGLGNGLADIVPGRFPVPQNPIMAGQQMMLPAPVPTGHPAAAGVGAIFNPYGRAM